MSFKKSSNTSFIVFIVSIILTLFFSSRSKMALLMLNIPAYCAFRFLGLLAILASIISFICIICYESCSNHKVQGDKDALNNVYSDGKNKFMKYFKSYIVLNLTKDTNPNYENDLDYLLSNFTKDFDAYKIQIHKIIESLSLEDIKISENVFIPEYIEILYKCISEKTLPAEDFVSSIDSVNTYLYKEDIKYVYSDDTKVYMLKDLFINRMIDINETVLKNLK